MLQVLHSETRLGGDNTTETATMALRGICFHAEQCGCLLLLQRSDTSNRILLLRQNAAFVMHEKTIVVGCRTQVRSVFSGDAELGNM